MTQTEQNLHGVRDPYARIALAAAVLAMLLGAAALIVGVSLMQMRQEQAKATDLVKLRETVAKDSKELAGLGQRLDAMIPLADELGKQVRDIRGAVARLEATRVGTAGGGSPGMAASAPSLDEVKQALGQLDTITTKHTEQLRLLKEVLEEHMKWHKANAEAK